MAGDVRAGSNSKIPLAAVARGATRYQGQRGVLATRHHKLSLIGPALHAAVGLTVDDIAVDTDSLGTFTGDVIRTGTPWDTAVAKARLGMQAAGCQIGIASEGSIGAHPEAPFVIRSVELVVLVDDELGIVVGETETGYDIVAVADDVAVGDTINDLLVRARFPEHAMTVRPATGPTDPIFKGIRTLSALDQAIRECAKVSSDQRAHVETDLRAHQCPTRRPIIARAAEHLAARLAACCPECNAPGWGIVRLEFGVPCEYCRRRVHIPRADVLGCAACPATRTVPREQTVADPAQCASCNP